MNNIGGMLKPTLEQAEFLFNKFPDKTLREWAEDWGMSHENVRLMKKKLGLNTSSRAQFDETAAQEIVQFIADGKGTLNTARTYEPYKFGKVAFKKWVEERPELAQAIEEAELKAWEDKINPTHKKCATTGEVLPVSEFYKDKSTLDGYSVRSKKVVKEMAKKYYDMRNVSEPTVTEKLCSGVPEIGPLPASEFAKNTKSATGLQTYSKKFQTLYQKYLNKNDIDAFDKAKSEALEYYKSKGY